VWSPSGPPAFWENVLRRTIECQVIVLKDLNMPDEMITRRSLITVAFLGLTGCFGGSTAVVFAPRVWFVAPANNALVTSPVRVVFGLQSMVVRPTSDTTTPDSGHHHLIIDRPPIPAGRGIPFDANHLHLGSGGAALSVNLSPGPHTLTAQFANSQHVAYGGLLTATIRVEVVTIG
jgi:hypothetical protein